MTSSNGRSPSAFEALERAAPELAKRARRAVARASVLAEAPGSSYVPSGARQYEASENGPAGWAGSLSGQIVARLARVETLEELERAVKWAEGEIHAAQHTPTAPTMPFKQRVLEEWEGQHYANVAVITRTPPTTIRQWRQDDGRDPLYGRRDGRARAVG